MIRKAMRFVLLASAGAMFDCQPLDAIPENTCGNAAIEEDREECDSFPSQPTKDYPRQCGAAGAAGQCRLLCNRRVALDDKTDVALECPPGWGCAVDNICRRPIGDPKKKSDPRFYEAGDPVSAGVSSLLVGDFDGDRRKDIFGSSALGATAGKGRIHYFGQGATLSGQPVPLNAVITSPVVRDFDNDGRDDLAFGYNYRFLTQVAGGIALLLGQSDRAIVPKLFPSFIRPTFNGKIVPVAGNDPGNPSGFIAIGSGVQEGRVTSGLVAIGDSGATAYIREFKGGNPNVVGTPIADFLLPKANLSYCGELVVAYNADDGPHLDVHSPCVAVAPADRSKTVWAVLRESMPIDLGPAKNAKLVGVHLADVDHDGNKDIIVGTNANVFVAYGTGTSFQAARKLDLLDELPLASGDINKDGFVDFVVSDAVLMSQRKCQVVTNGGSGCADPPPDEDAGAGDGGADGGGTDQLSGYYTVKLPTKRWTVAVVDDVNGDGIPDVIGGSNLQPDIDVLQGNTAFVPGTGQPLKGVFMPSFTVTTNGVVTQLIVEDLDVDGTRDIAFVTQRVFREPATTKQDDPPEPGELAIAYGRPLTMPPEAARPSGRVDGITQLFSQTAGLAICSSTPVKGTLPTFSLAILFGSGERQPFAPLLFDDGPGRAIPRVPPIDRSWSPRTIGAGAVEEKGRFDFIALAEGTRVPKLIGDRVPKPDAYGIWTAKQLSTAIYDSPTERLRVTDLEAAAAAGAQLLLQTQFIDTDKDGLDEIVAVTPAGPTTSAIRVLRVNKPEVTVTIPDRTITEDARIAAVDIDGDGTKDLLVLLRDNSNTLQVTAYYGNGTGGFIVPGTPVVLPDSQNPKHRNARGFALLTTQAGDGAGKASDVVRQLVVVTPEKLFLVKPKGRGFETAEDITSALGNGLAYGTDVATGDFDGDGVEDVAVADAGQIRILRQRPRLE